VSPDEARCRLCASGALQVFFERASTPVLANRFHASARDALDAPTGCIMLAHCTGCGAIQNTRFDAGAVDYGDGYENALHYSAGFRAFSAILADRLARDECLRGGTAVEIGCGDGAFLTLLCERAGCAGIGVDPALPPVGERLAGPRVRLLGRSFDAVDLITPDTKLVICRQVLEHLAGPRDLLLALARVAAGASRVRFYIEVPNAMAMLEAGAIWDVIYEHPLYFTAESLERLLRDCGYAIAVIDEAFHRQYLYAEGTIADGGRDDRAQPSTAGIGASAELLARFGHAGAAALNRWNDFLENQRSAARIVALWGIGSKGVTFLNALEDPSLIAVAVDLNPRKQGRHVPGTGHRIAAPAELARVRPDVVLVSNRIYAQEIERALRALELAPKLELL